MNNHLMPNIWVRLTEQQLKDLDYIASELPGARSDHARQAIKEYNARMLPIVRAGLVPAPSAQTTDITLRETA